MQAGVERRSVDLSEYPELVMVLLGLRVRSVRGLFSALRIGRGLATIQRDAPEGLLAHDNFLWGWNHVGIRQYWRDLESLERFTRSAPHSGWWKSFLRDNGGAGFWHEAYSRNGIEAVYLDMPPVGLARFAPERAPVGPFMSTRERLDRDCEAMSAS
jgi:hypothetical protein